MIVDARGDTMFAFVKSPLIIHILSSPVFLLFPQLKVEIAPTTKIENNLGLIQLKL